MCLGRLSFRSVSIGVSQIVIVFCADVRSPRGVLFHYRDGLLPQFIKVGFFMMSYIAVNAVADQFGDRDSTFKGYGLEPP